MRGGASWPPCQYCTTSPAEQLAGVLAAGRAGLAGCSQAVTAGGKPQGDVCLAAAPGVPAALEICTCREVSVCYCAQALVGVYRCGRTLLFAVSRACSCDHPLLLCLARQPDGTPPACPAALKAAATWTPWWRHCSRGRMQLRIMR